MTQLTIIGAGGHGKVVLEAAQQTGRWTGFQFADSGPAAGSMLMGIPVLLLSDWMRAGLHDGEAVVAIGHAESRLRIASELRSTGMPLAVVIHPRAVVSRSAILGSGTVVLANAVVNAMSVIGDCCIINSGATVDHDCMLGEGVHVCPGANVAGGVKIGPRSWIGIGSCVREYSSIGADILVGAGSVVVDDLNVPGTYFGVPAQLRRST
jgi:sugar O-acyltransferase (sialic acid O-acetyltransferase NeuD family)